MTGEQKHPRPRTAAFNEQDGRFYVAPLVREKTGLVSLHGYPVAFRSTHDVLSIRLESEWCEIPILWVQNHMGRTPYARCPTCHNRARYLIWHETGHFRCYRCSPPNLITLVGQHERRRIKIAKLEGKLGPKGANGVPQRPSRMQAGTYARLLLQWQYLTMDARERYENRAKIERWKQLAERKHL